jgi:hypothetical protein
MRSTSATLDDPRKAARDRLSSDDLQERCRGVEALAAIPGEDVTEELATLLEESSWYLRDRVVTALATRPGALASIGVVLASGSWFARASACDVLGRTGDVGGIPDLLTQIEDRNVSLQKSAIDAVERIARTHGPEPVASALATLDAEIRRRVRARIAHQSPEWGATLDAAIERLPAGSIEPASRVINTGMSSAQEVKALVRFRKWLASLPVSSEGRT